MRRDFAEADVFQDAAEGAFQIIDGVDFSDVAVGDEFAVNQHHFVAILRHRAEVVGGNQHQIAFVAQGFQKLHHRKLRFRIDAGKRFIQKNNAALLGEGAGEKNALFLPAGERADLPLGKVSDAEAIERGGDRLAVGRTRSAQRPHVAITPQHDDIFHQNRKMPVNILALRHISDAVLPHRLRDRQTIDTHAARLRADDAHDGVKQRRFAGTINAYQGAHGAPLQGESDIADGLVTVRISHADMLNRERNRLSAGSH